MRTSVLFLLLFLLAVLALADVGKHTPSAWNVDKKYTELWNQMKHVVSPEAARYAENRRARERTVDLDPSPFDVEPTPELLDHIVGRYDDDEPSLIFEHLLELIASEQWTLIKTTLTKDVHFVDHTNGLILDGVNTVVGQFQQDVSDDKQRCLQNRCVNFGLSVEHVATQGPVAVFRVTDTMKLVSGQTTRTLHIWNIILRPPGPQRPLAHSEIAVIERMSSSIRADYKPPVELFAQKQYAEQFVREFTNHWHEIHRQAIAEEEEAVVRNMQLGAADPEHWAMRTRKFCENRQKRGEIAETFDCEEAQAQFSEQAHRLKELAKQHRLRRAREGK